jgi:hypothetical protein
MKYRSILSAFIIVGSLTAPLAAAELAKPKVLSNVEERRWIDAVKNRQTADGPSCRFCNMRKK